MEKLLTFWIDDQTHRNMPLSQGIIMEKAKILYLELKNRTEECSTAEGFVASRGWFERFKLRANLHSISLSGESASADKESAKVFKKNLEDIIKQKNYPRQLIFNFDETGLFWKKMPSKTFISKEEISASGFKAAKDRLTLLLGGNSTGDFRMKPLLIYHSENPRAMKGISKQSLPVIWMANQKSWMTAILFKKWYQEHFCPAVKSYCERNVLEKKALLILDNAPGHPQNLSEFQTCLPVEIIFTPPNTTSILQPMDQGVIATFKAYYIRKTFKQLFQAVDSNQCSIKEFWKNFNIMNAIENIGSSWQEVQQSCLK